MPSERASICSSSSVVNAGPSRAARFSSSCAGRDAPISADATTGSRSTHWIASCASVCPRSFAMTSSPRRRREALLGQRRLRQRRALLRALARCRRRGTCRSAGPARAGVNAIAPMPSCFRTPVSPSSTQRFRIEYDGWWMTSGVPSAARDRGRDRRPLGAVRRDADVQRLALPHEGVERADRLLDRGHRVDAVRVEDVDVVDAHPRRATARRSRGCTCASPGRRTGRATCRSRPSTR